jgi:hypothetical protein
VRHAALRCAGAVLGRLWQLHASTSGGDTSQESPAADAPAAGSAASGSAAADAATSGVVAGSGSADVTEPAAAAAAAAVAAAGSVEAAGGGGPLASLDAAARWLLEAAEGGAGAGEAPELRLAIADAIAAAGDALCLSIAGWCSSWTALWRCDGTADTALMVATGRSVRNRRMVRQIIPDAVAVSVFPRA